jgi:hypothetical protein
MNDLAIPALSLEQFDATPSGLIITGEPSYEVWEAYGAALCTIEGAMPFIIGDWLNFGHALYGEKYVQALTKWPDRKLQTLINYAYVARNVPMPRRREDVSFSVHAEVASLEPAEQEDVLERAAEQELTVSEVRDMRRPVDGIDEFLAENGEVLRGWLDRWEVRVIRAAIRKLEEWTCIKTQ